MAAQQPAPNYLSLDMNRPMQTGQPALSRPVAPPIGRVAMPAAPMAMAPAPTMPVAPPAPPVADAAPPVMAPAPVAVQVSTVAMTEAPIPAQIMQQVAPVEAPAAAPTPMPAPPPAAPMPMPIPAAAAVATPATPVHKPLVDETDWRVSRPATRPVVRAEQIGRPMAARPVAAEARSPNLFQRITGAFAAPKPATGSVAPTAATGPAEPSMTRPVPENAIAVAPKVAPRPAPLQTSISLDVTERVKPARDDDDLQIPAFLRRQAN
jgi:cell division protein FtsZ